MRVLIAPSSFYPAIGGIETITRELALGLISRGHQVDILTINPFGREKSEETKQGLDVRRCLFLLPSKNIISTIKFALYFVYVLPQIIFYIKKNNVEIMNIQGISAQAFYLVLAAKLCRIPLITSTHGEVNNDDAGIFNKSFMFKLILILVVNVSKKIVYCSQYCERELPIMMDIPKKKVRVITNGMDATCLPKRIKNRMNRFLMAGRLEKVKNFDLVIKLFAKHRQVVSGYELVIVGSGSEEYSLRKLVEELVLENISFITNADRKKVLELMISSKGVFVPSRSESFGMVCLEALSCGTPVFVANTGDMSAMVLEGFGEVVDIANEKMVEATFIRFINQINEYNVNDRYIKEKYSYTKMIDEYEKMFKDNLR